jgi:hypothetical protein
MVSTMDPYDRILGFLDWNRYFSSKWFLNCTHKAEWIPFQTQEIWQRWRLNPDFWICSQKL